MIINIRQKAEQLLKQGLSVQAVAKAVGCDRATVTRWKKNPFTPDENPLIWLDNQIIRSMQNIDRLQGEEKDFKLERDILDDFIGMKKKYDSSLDRYGETKKVFEDFSLFIAREHPESAGAIAQMMAEYAEFLGR
ncbi:MAG: helix-turn-helix domain-containing protein [Brevinema sp.]